jgi:uncharacterized protein (TIGR03435 family)
MRPTVYSLPLLCAVSMAGPLQAQPDPRPAFEVASVRLVEQLRGQLIRFSSSGPRARYIAYPTVQLIREAYNLQKYEVAFAAGVEPPVGGAYNPAFYDIEAKAEGDGPRTRNEFRAMLERLLAERFKLRVHRESRQLKAYSLLVSKNGPKFTESAKDGTESAHISNNGGNISVTATKFGVDDLASLISDVFLLDRPLVNRTGFTGNYDFKIEARAQTRMSGDDPDLSGISIFTALQQQLGLKLESQTVPIDVLVVDHIERPSAN